MFTRRFIQAALVVFRANGIYQHANKVYDATFYVMDKTSKPTTDSQLDLKTNHAQLSPAVLVLDQQCTHMNIHFLLCFNFPKFPNE